MTFQTVTLANSSKPCENSLFEDVFKVSAPSFHTSSKSFDNAQYGLVDKVLWQIIPYCLQGFLQLLDGIWLGLKCLVAFPDKVNSVQLPVFFWVFRRDRAISQFLLILSSMEALPVTPAIN